MTTIATIVKANATTITTACGITVTSTSKGVPGQFDKVINLINQLPEGEVVVEAGKLKGVFKALKENSKDCTTFSFVLACNGWGLESEGDNSWVIVRPQGNITLINGSYVEPTQPEEVEMEVENGFNFKTLPFKKQSDINCLLLSIGGKTFPQSLNDIEDSIARVSSNEDESVQLTIRELEAFVEKYRPSQIKKKVVTVSEVTQNEEVKVKPKTFCQLLREEWLPSRESWVIDTLKRKMRATWKARKELTCERQGKFMAEFFRRLDAYSPNTELPLQAFLTTYDLVKEDMTGQKTQVSVPEALKVIQKDHNTEEVNDAYTNHLNNLLNKFPDRSVEAVTQPSITPVENFEEEFQLTSPEELPERVVVDEKDVYLDEGVCKAIRQACMQLMAENLKGGNEFYKGKYVGSYTVYEPEFWLAKAHQQLHGYYFENYVEEKDTGDLTVEIVRESYRTTPAGDTARAFLGTLGLVSEEVALDWEICINTPNADEEDCEPGDCFEFGLVW
jgi:hypothetical protein